MRIQLTQPQVDLLLLLLSLDGGSIGLDAKQEATAIRLKEKLQLEKDLYHART